MDSDGRHYASASVAVPNGTYEGQLVIGDSFVYPVKKFTVTSSNDIIVLQFDVEQGRELSGRECQINVHAYTMYIYIGQTFE